MTNGTALTRQRVGIIDSLSAGYRFLGRRVEVLLIPILLDLLLWLGPRLSVAPIFQQIADFYRNAATMEGMPADMVEMSRQVSELLTTAGDNSNLLDGLANTSLLHVPSLLVAAGSQGSMTLSIAHPLAAAALFGSFGLLGLLIGVVYMNLLAAHSAHRRRPQAAQPQRVCRHRSPSLADDGALCTAHHRGCDRHFHSDRVGRRAVQPD